MHHFNVKNILESGHIHTPHPHRAKGHVSWGYPTSASQEIIICLRPCCHLPGGVTVTVYCVYSRVAS